MQAAGGRRIAGIFAGIGGFELGLSRSGHTTSMLCESWKPAVEVLRSSDRFRRVPVHPDVATLTPADIPDEVDLITAGFPCTDLSQVGRTDGIHGANSRLILHVFDLLEEIRQDRRPLPDLLLENVANMLVLGKGRAMQVLIARCEALGYRWAYRTVDSRFTGVPQRRRRVFLYASTELDPSMVLFADDQGEPPADRYRDDAFGFYWTEGRRGLGWAQDAIPTLKGGSGLGIPSPPAVWLRHESAGRQFVKPTIEDAEALQGFKRGHTATEVLASQPGSRWKLVGNAVTVGVAEWLGERISDPADPVVDYRPWHRSGSWPKAAMGSTDTASEVFASEYPRVEPYLHLRDLLSVPDTDPLSARATGGFLSRLRETNLGRYEGFRDALDAHLGHWELA